MKSKSSALKFSASVLRRARRIRLLLMDVDGTMTVLRAGRRKQLLAQIEMDAPLYSRPAQVADALYLATANRLYFIAADSSNRVSQAEQNMKGKGVFPQ